MPEIDIGLSCAIIKHRMNMLAGRNIGFEHDTPAGLCVRKAEQLLEIITKAYPKIKNYEPVMVFIGDPIYKKMRLVYALLDCLEIEGNSLGSDTVEKVMDEHYYAW